MVKKPSSKMSNNWQKAQAIYALLQKGAKMYGRSKAAYSGSKGSNQKWGSKRKSKTNTQKLIQQDGTGCTSSNALVKYKPFPLAKKIMKLSEVNIWQYSNTFQSTTAFNTQACNVLIPCCNYTDINNIAQQNIIELSTTGGTPLNSVDGYTTLNSNYKRNNTIRVVVRTVRNDYFFTNNTSANTFLTIYDFKVTRDNSISYSSIISSGDQDANDNSFTSQTSLFVTPFYSPTFCTMNKVIKVTRVELAQGRTHRHTCIYHINQVVDYERIRNNLYYKNLTHGIVCMAYGSPCNDSVNLTNVGTSQVKIDCVYNSQYEWQQLPIPTKLIALGNNLGAITNADIINEGSGAAVTEVIA